MNRKTISVAAVGFLAGLLVAVSLHAAEALLVAGLQSAGKNGSWERIAVGAVYYEGGDKTRGQAIFDEVLNGKPEWTDFQRTARLYAELGEWDKAKPVYEKAIAMKPGKADLLAEVGAYYNLHGDRAKAEELFTKAFQSESNDPWAYSMAAASYLGKNPRPW